MTSDRSRRRFLGATLTTAALVTILAVGVVYVGTSRHGSARLNLSVVVAAREIPSGQHIFPDMVKMSAIGATGLPAGAFAQPSEVWFRIASVPIHANEVVTNDRLAAICAAWSCPPPRDYVARTLPPAVLGPARSIKAGDYVDFIATVNTAVFSPAHPRWASRMVFTGVAVIGVGPPATNVVVSLCDSHYIDWFAVNGFLAYAVGSPNYSTEIAPADVRCADPTPARVDSRWGFSEQVSPSSVAGSGGAARTGEAGSHSGA